MYTYYKLKFCKLNEHGGLLHLNWPSWLFIFSVYSDDWICYYIHSIPQYTAVKNKKLSVDYVVILL